MDDGVSITFDFRLKPETAENFLAAGAALLHGTSDFPGFRSIRIVRHKIDRNRVLFIEHWDSEEGYGKYIAWRTESGMVAAFDQIVESSTTNIWPALIIEAQSAEAISETQGISITFELVLKPEMIGPFTDNKAMFGAVSNFPGFRAIRLVQHKDDPARILFIERWDNEAAYQAYVDWQTERGGMEGIRQMTTHMETNIWPTLVTHA